MKHATTLALALLAAATVAGSASAAPLLDPNPAIAVPILPPPPPPPRPPPLIPVLYSVYGVADGQLNGLHFSGAQFRLDFRSYTIDTKSVIENGATVYRNDVGQAVLTLQQGLSTTVANIAANQIFVRYDATNGVVGFGSYAVGPFYPVALSWCTDPATCSSSQIGTGYADDMIVGALVQLREDPQDSMFYSPAVPHLATQLKGPALLGGFLYACLSFDFTTHTCPSIPSVPIKTDHGDLYFQTQSAYGGGIFTAILGAGTPW
ncbi:MAG: hypothetical protein JO133_00220 [Burkholderiaceae bacterium]|nr:hypothetical protein [Burkholderiaceae bacterium]